MKHCMHGALFLIQITIVGRFVCMVIVQTEKRDMAYTALRFAEEGYMF